MRNLDHPSRITAMRRRRAAQERAQGNSLLSDNGGLPPQRVGKIELAIWTFAVFLLTSPFTFWAMGTDPVTSEFRDLSSMRGSDGSQWRLYAMRAAVLLMGMLLTVQNWRYLPIALRRLWPLLPFFAWASLTIAWSDSAITSANSVLALMLLFGASVFMCIRLSYTGVARVLLLSTISLILVSIAFALFLPDYGMHQEHDVTQAVHAGAWRGSYFHKNQLGQTCAIMVVALVVTGDTFIRSRLLKWAMVAILGGMIVLSTSASAAVTVPLALALHWFFIELPPAKRLRALLYIVPLIIGGVFAASQIVVALGRDVTLTGRTEVWAVAWDWFTDRPLLGYGFNTLTYGGFSFELHRKRGLVDPHNGYFETAMGTGVIGLVLFLIPLVLAIIYAHRQYAAGGAARETATVFAAVLIAWMIASFTEVDFRPFSPAGGLGYLAMCGLLMMPPINRGRTLRPGMLK